MKYQINLLLTALTFFSRIPVPFKLNYSSEIMNKSSRYYSLVGLVIGAIAAGIYLLANLAFAHHIAVVISLAATVLVTGAFHEDGFADSCDGLGGGYQKEKILEIMKDSRIGTFGAIGLLLLMVLKILAMLALPEENFALALIMVHCISRAFSAGFIYSSTYVSSSLSKSKPLANIMSFRDLLLNLLVGIGSYFLFFPNQYWLFLAIIITIALSFLFLKHYIEHRIGGYTGDVLGAFQQIFEVIIYLIMGSKLWALL